ncbi:zf-HC2 domain-containing protein [Methylolobus aquaticus]
MVAEDKVFVARHEEVLLLLPWYANGSLSAAEHLAVDQHLGTCDDCRKELADFQQIQNRWQHAPADPTAESGFARLMARIDAAGIPEAKPATAHESDRAAEGAAARSSGLRHRFSE